MDMIDRLRELDAAASPGPWTWKTGESIDAEQGDKGHDPVVLDAEGNINGGPLIILAGVWEDDARDRANISLASLAHQVLPLAEALERLLLAHSLACGDSLTGAREGDEGRAVLAQLEEALG